VSSKVNGAVVCTLGQDDTVEVEFDHDYVIGEHPAVSGNVESVTAYGETRAIGVVLFGAIVDTDAPICDVLEPGEWDFIACNEYDSIGAFADARNALSQAAKFSGIRLPQSSLYFGSIRRCRISKSSSVSMSRTALCISMGNEQCAAFAGVRLRELM
jgi:hypothetical protein